MKRRRNEVRGVREERRERRKGKGKREEKGREGKMEGNKGTKKEGREDHIYNNCYGMYSMLHIMYMYI